MKTVTPNMPRFFIEQKRAATRPNTWRRDLWIAWCDLDWFELYTLAITFGSIAAFLLVELWG